MCMNTAQHKFPAIMDRMNRRMLYKGSRNPSGCELHYCWSQSSNMIAILADYGKFGPESQSEELEPLDFK